MQICGGISPLRNLWLKSSSESWTNFSHSTGNSFQNWLLLKLCNSNKFPRVSGIEWLNLFVDKSRYSRSLSEPSVLEVSSHKVYYYSKQDSLRTLNFQVQVESLQLCDSMKNLVYVVGIVKDIALLSWRILRKRADMYLAPADMLLIFQ